MVSTVPWKYGVSAHHGDWCEESSERRCLEAGWRGSHKRRNLCWTIDSNQDQSVITSLICAPEPFFAWKHPFAVVRIRCLLISCVESTLGAERAATGDAGFALFAP